MTWAVYGHGSFWRGLPDASDIDVLVITTEPLSRLEAAHRVPAAVQAARSSGLPLDVTVATPAAVRAEPIMRACVLAGELLDGAAFEVDPFTCEEWARVMRQLATSPGLTPGARVLAELRARWASGGRLVLAKSAVPTEARGTVSEEAARTAWAHRHESPRPTP